MATGGASISKKRYSLAKSIPVPLVPLPTGTGTGTASEHGVITRWGSIGEFEKDTKSETTMEEESPLRRALTFNARAKRSPRRSQRRRSAVADILHHLHQTTLSIAVTRYVYSFERMNCIKQTCNVDSRRSFVLGLCPDRMLSEAPVTDFPLNPVARSSFPCTALFVRTLQFGIISAAPRWVVQS